MFVETLLLLLVFVKVCVTVTVPVCCVCEIKISPEAVRPLVKFSKSTAKVTKIGFEFS